MRSQTLNGNFPKVLIKKKKKLYTRTTMSVLSQVSGRASNLVKSGFKSQYADRHMWRGKPYSVKQDSPCKINASRT